MEKRYFEVNSREWEITWN